MNINASNSAKSKEEHPIGQAVAVGAHFLLTNFTKSILR
jgi:hypothetical protein